MAAFRVSQRFQIFNQVHLNEVTELFSGSTLLDLDGNGEDIGEIPSVDEETSFDSLQHIDSDKNAPLVPEEEADVSGSDSFSEAKLDAGLMCTTCDVKFVALSDQRQHFRLDWHRYNLKRKSHNQAPVNEENFQEMMDGLSSISGSDAEDSVSISNPLSRLLEKVIVEDLDEKKPTAGSRTERITKNYSKIYCKTKTNQVISFYAAVLPPGLGKWHRDSDSLEKVLPYMREVVTRSPKVGIFMISGGHFAAGLFEGTTEILHKTFHSYTVRAKQGGAQGSRDAKNGSSHPKSAGASLRRYNEQAFNQHVQDLLAAWKEKIDQCELIFYRAVSFNRNILFGGQNPPLDKSDARLKTIPFQTKRPTFSEVKRVLAVLTTIELLGDVETFKSTVLKQKRSRSDAVKTKKIIDRAKSRSPIVRDEPPIPPSSPETHSEGECELIEVETVIDFQSELQEYGDSFSAQEPKKKGSKKKKAKTKNDEFVKPTGILELTLKAMQEKNLSLTDELITKLKNEFPSGESFWNQPVDIQSLTLLHYATKYDLQEIVWTLLDYGCDPTLKDKLGKCSYNWASTKDCRRVYMRFQAEFPDKYDYAKAQVPGPLTKEMEDQKAEKQKALNKIKREKEKMKKQEKKEKQQEIDEKNRYLNLSDREKRALAAERRILGQAVKTGDQKPILQLNPPNEYFLLNPLLNCDHFLQI
ncbi:unnamed protein product [Allacma fusca]|uniref:VLRF1 domain-containing protein n=1 Tax=Allacma fusca TaxID=39272 RepID=A0A8J2LFN8_9HEXA|nr:unnamed protein product [Allacma fusca]